MIVLEENNERTPLKTPQPGAVFIPSPPPPYESIEAGVRQKPHHERWLRKIRRRKDWQGCILLALSVVLLSSLNTWLVVRYLTKTRFEMTPPESSIPDIPSIPFPKLPKMPSEDYPRLEDMSNCFKSSGWQRIPEQLPTGSDDPSPSHLVPFVLPVGSLLDPQPEPDTKIDYVDRTLEDLVLVCVVTSDKGEKTLKIHMPPSLSETDVRLLLPDGQHYQMHRISNLS
ncbi:hypothetical protein C8J56DRAFT_932727 [Mycena floridula]|nr:hypothetical protein C8J56DRAFT_932727 [Mycena floridula]